MRDINILCGMNAGKIWKALDSKESLTKIQLLNETNMKENELFQAIGWLAKENKIKKDGEFYQLDQTNISDKIENNAEKISSLFENGKFNFDNLENLTEIDYEDYNLALGWLAREGKLENEILTDCLELKSNQFEINKLKNELDNLNSDLEIRDIIIKELKNQLTLNQFHKIENSDKNYKIKNEINQKNNKILEQKNELNSKKLEISNLKTELDNLNLNIETRNIIIKQITDQLTEKQTQFIENSNEIKNLEIELNKNFVKITNEKLNNRLGTLTNIQEISNDKLDSDISKSTLFSKTDSIFNKKEKIDDINNELHEINRDNSIFESNKINKSTLKNRKDEIEDE